VARWHGITCPFGQGYGLLTNSTTKHFLNIYKTKMVKLLLSTMFFYNKLSTFNYAL
jgi:hypothetical protein